MQNLDLSWKNWSKPLGSPFGMLKMKTIFTRQYLLYCSRKRNLLCEKSWSSSKTSLNLPKKSSQDIFDFPSPPFSFVSLVATKMLLLSFAVFTKISNEIHQHCVLSWLFWCWLAHLSVIEIGFHKCVARATETWVCWFIRNKLGCTDQKLQMGEKKEKKKVTWKHAYLLPTQVWSFSPKDSVHTCGATCGKSCFGFFFSPLEALKKKRKEKEKPHWVDSNAQNLVWVPQGQWSHEKAYPKW